MLAQLTSLLRTALVAQGCPVPVIDGPERSAAASADTRIVVQRTVGEPENVRAPMSRPVNPKAFAVREIACLIRIYARSTVSGASVRSHLALADALADLVVVQMTKVVQSQKQGLPRWGAGKVVPLADLELEGMQTWRGVVYDLPVSIDRGVLDRTWALAARSEFDLDAGAIRSVTLVGESAACGEID